MGLRLPAVLPNIIGDGSWSLFAKMYAQIIQLAIFIVAARILEPAEFGFFAFASAISVILVVLSEGGWREFVLKSRNCRERLDEIATTSLMFAATFTVVCLAIAFELNRQHEGNWQAILVALFSIWIIPAALSTIYEGLIVANGFVRSHARLLIAAETAGFATALLGLHLGWGVVALVAGKLSMQLTYLVCAIAITRWIPRPRFDWNFTKELLDFSRHILLNRVMQQIRSYAGTLAVGMFLGMTEAGLFRAAERVVAAFSELVAEPARTLAWVVFRRTAEVEGPQSDVETLDRAGTRFIILLIFAAAPVFVGLALISDEVIHLLLGEKWAPAALIVSLLCIRQVLLIPSAVTEPLLSISGYVRKMPSVALLNAVVAVGAMVALAPFGLLAATLGQIGAAAIAFGTTLHLQRRYGNIRWSFVSREILMVLVGIAALSIMTFWARTLLDPTGWSTIIKVAVEAVSGAVGYCGTLLVAWMLGFGRAIFSDQSGPHDVRSQPVNAKGVAVK